jgi:hypothetical protein
MALRLTENEEDVHDPANDESCNFPILLHHPVQDQGKRIQHTASAEDSAEIVLRCRTLKFENAIDTVDTNQDEIAFGVHVFFQEFDKYVDTTTPNKHLHRECASLVHLSDKCCGLFSDIAGVSFVCKWADGGNASQKRQALLGLGILKNNQVNDLQQGKNNVVWRYGA